MSIKRNFIYNLSYQILIMILPFITTPYVSRVIGAEGVGIQSYTFSIANYFVLFATLGINNHGNRSIAMARQDKEKLNKTFISIYLVQVIMAILMMILYSIYIVFVVSEYKIIFTIQLIYIISALLDINWFFFGMEQFKLTVLRNTIIKLLSILSIFIFVKNNDDLYLYSLILALGSLISQLILWKYLKKDISFVKVGYKDIRDQIKPIIILFIPVIAVSIYKILDKIMLGSISTITQVGYFENSEKIINMPLGIISALGTVMLPKMSNLLSNGYEAEGKKYILISIKFVMFIAFGAMFGLIGISNVFIPIFLGSEFTPCIVVMSVLSVTILFIAWANVIRTQFLIPKKKDKIYIISTFLGAVINIILNLLLIGKFGAIGAAIGTIFAEGSVSIYQTIMVRKELEIKKYFMQSIFFLFPGIIICILVKYIGNLLGVNIITGLIQITIGGLIYCIISGIYLYFTKDELIMSIINSALVRKYKNRID
ncbi:MULTISPECIES: flippase [Clostridium]|uniref:flippase n=1 Tax=Clostridium TaxID=1485 RepID=UPI00035E3F0E|nr:MULTISPECIES: flippase [Clostridium]MBN1036871.1 flippase [Clostridium botulinum]MBY7026495.1 flippase [Clostridium botulinum]